MAEPGAPVAPRAAPPLLALIGGQIGLHAGMTGVRMAAPLLALRDGWPAWVVGLLMGFFAAAPIVLAMHSGRLADRYGYHRPMRIAVALSVCGGLLACAATTVRGDAVLVILCLAAAFSGAGANFGMIAIQRTAGRGAADATALKRVFSWLAFAPALSNALGPVLAGVLIDAGGYRLAFGGLLLLPLAALGFSRRVPVEPPRPAAATATRRRAWDLFAVPGFRRLLFVNWLLSSCWDVHSFVVPVLGHERGFSASAIGLVIGAFATAAAAVRLVIPVVAHRLREARVLVGSMLLTAAVFAVYPLMRSAAGMMVCATVLGFALGAVQPMVMATLHQLTPDDRHGEAIALRSMAINFSSTMMPLLFGAVGTAVGAGGLFWLVGAVVAAGSAVARRVGATGAADGRVSG